MGVTANGSGVVVAAGQAISLATLFPTISGSSPTYLVLNAFDRDEYTASASGATGHLSGSGSSLGLSAIGGDERGAGIVFTYQSATGRYYNSTFGYLDQMTYTASTSSGDVTDLSLFGTSSSRTANAYANDAMALSQVDPTGYRGTITVATVPSFSDTAPAQATPDSIAATADSFVGQSWNMDGCWVLASTIAAEAGASLPVQSSADIAGAANGEWFVAFNGPAGSTGNWQSMVQEGDIVGFITGSGSGHITTCVSGVGSSARLVDNETLVGANGNIVNAANDGSSDDITIQSAHLASQEWSGVQASSVVIFRLDTPVVTATSSLLTLAANGTEGLNGLFTAADPAGHAVTEYQVYDTGAGATLTEAGAAVAAGSAGSAVTVASLGSLTLDSESGSGDVVVRAYNGAYWGDWTSLAVTGNAATTTIAPVTPSASASAGTPTATTTTTTDTTPVYRFFDNADGTHFFTSSATERDSLLATRPDMTYEGVGMDAFATATADAAAEPVYRFFDASDGTHFFTASAAERNGLIATRPDMTFEGVAFYEDATQQAGDTAVYRFFDSAHGTHLFTDSAAERASILATRPDLESEGIAFYAPA